MTCQVLQFVVVENSFNHARSKQNKQNTPIYGIRLQQLFWSWNQKEMIASQFLLKLTIQLNTLSFIQ